jgi:hypothetical protein
MAGGAAFLFFIVCWALSRRFERFPGTGLWLVCIGGSLYAIGLDVGGGVLTALGWAADKGSDALAFLSTIGSNG